MSSIHLSLMIETGEDGVFTDRCPAFKGCHSYGSTVDEAIANIKEVIAMCMEEERPEPLNRFIGFREIEMPTGRVAS